MKRIISAIIISCFFLVPVYSSGEQEAVQDTANYPEKDITIIIPSPPGDNTDIQARLVGKYVQKYLPNKVNIIYENKPGAAATIGLTSLYNSKADGYTIGMTPAAAITIKPHEGITPYKYDSFQAIANIDENPMYLVVSENAPYRNFKEWLLYVQKNPGYKIGIAGIGNAQHVPMIGFEAEAEIDLNYVVYPGAIAIAAAVLGGNIESGLIGGPIMVQYSETLLPIFNMTALKTKLFSWVPTFQELGYEARGVFFDGVLAPKNLPEDILKILSEAFGKALQEPEIIERIEEMGLIHSYLNPKGFQKLITETSEYSKLILEEIQK